MIEDSCYLPTTKINYILCVGLCRMAIGYIYFRVVVFNTNAKSGVEKSLPMVILHVAWCSTLKKQKNTSAELNQQTCILLRSWTAMLKTPHYGISQNFTLANFHNDLNIYNCSWIKSCTLTNPVLLELSKQL